MKEIEYEIKFDSSDGVPPDGEILEQMLTILFNEPGTSEDMSYTFSRIVSGQGHTTFYTDQGDIRVIGQYQEE